MSDVITQVREDWRYRHEGAVEWRRPAINQLTSDLRGAMTRVESMLDDGEMRGSAGMWLSNESLLAVRHVLVALDHALAAAPPSSLEKNHERRQRDETGS